MKGTPTMTITTTETEHDDQPTCHAANCGRDHLSEPERAIRAENFERIWAQIQRGEFVDSSLRP